MAFAVGLAVVGEAGARLVVPGRDLAFALQLLVELFHLAFDVAAQDLEVDDDAATLVEAPFPQPDQSVHATHRPLPPDSARYCAACSLPPSVKISASLASPDPRSERVRNSVG